MLKGQKLFAASLVGTAVAVVATGMPIQAEETIATVSSTPALLITEVLPDSNNLESLDGYEYIEIYNNSTTAINLNDYQIIYQNLDTGKNYPWAFNKLNQMIQPGETIVVWILNNVITTQPTLADFNMNYGSTLTEEQLNTVTSGGMSNSAQVRLNIATKAGEIVSSVQYSKTDVAVHNGIHYQYDGSSTTLKKLSTAPATPGSISTDQLKNPEEPITPPVEEFVTTFTHTAAETIPLEDFKPSVAIETTVTVDNASLYYKGEGDDTWTGVAMQLNETTGKYEAVIPSLAIPSSTISYKFNIVGANKTFESDVYTSNVINKAIDENLIITEISPNSKNRIGTDGKPKDAFEYIEIYNNSANSINLNNYKIIYNNLSNTTPIDWTLTKKDHTIQPGETIVVWILNNGISAQPTLAEFNTNYGTTLTENQMNTILSAGMINSAKVRIDLATITGKIISSAEYDGTPDAQEHIGIHYTSDGSTSNVTKLNVGATSPGTITTDQITEEPITPPVEEFVTTFTHTAAENISLEDFKPSVAITSTDNIQTVSIYYRSLPEGTWSKRDMKLNATTGKYEALIPSLELVSKSIYYKFSVIGEKQTYESDIFTSIITDSTFDSNKAPILLVTELLPDSTNVDGNDGYEFIEIYNNSTEDINMKDYTIRYRYPMEGKLADLIWNPTKRDVVIKSGETLIYWIKNSKNQNKTITDFNQLFNTNYDENKVIEIQSDGMANSSNRGIVIATNTGKEISAAYYWDQPNVDDTASDKSIQYTYPQNGSINMIKYDYAVNASTPGNVSTIQFPETKTISPQDQQQPVIIDQTIDDTIVHGENAYLKFSVTDDTSIKTARLYYKVDGMTNYTVVDLQESNQDYYEYTISSPEILNKNQITYYLETSDGVNTVTTNEAHLSIEKAPIKEQGLNIDSGAVVSKTVHVKAYDNKESLIIDGNDVTSSTKKALSDNSYFVFDVKKANVFFKNGVTMGDEVLHIFDDTINLYETISVPIEAERFEVNKPIELAIRAGTKVSPFDLDSVENRDDFYIKNPRLILHNGTVVNDGNFTDSTKEYTVGDGGSAKKVFDFSFNVPELSYSALQYDWDTTKLSDGEHTLKSGDQTIQVVVDNTSPTIKPSVNGQPATAEALKGDITLDALINDNTSVNQVEATLDGKTIQLPYNTSSAALTAGEHTLQIKAIDAGGNESTKSITFTVVDEIPVSPERIKPNEKSDSANSATLEVKVADPTNDALQVSFFEGKHFNAQDAEVAIYENSSETEPPTTLLVEGEQLVQDKAPISSKDGIYVDTTSTTKFPYHRFGVSVGKDLTEADQIVIDWEGKSLIGRKVSMYVWNYTVAKWELQTSQITKDENNFTLQGKVYASQDYVKDGEIQVIIQDEVSKDALADYSLIWMSDTQYYSESYPHIYDAMTKWIKEKKDELNIKYVFHTGDLVDQAEEEIQWTNADKSMKTLEEAAVPYGVLAGNHDVGHKTGDYNAYGQYFGEDRFKNQPFYGESYKNNRGHYDLISANGNDFIMVYMGWGVNDEDIAWINKVLAENPNRTAILNFHEYMLISGNRSPIGDTIYENVVKKNSNVVAVLSGHYHDAETLVDEIDDNGDGTADRKVYQMLADYQGGPEGGQGYLRILNVNQAKNNISIQTYSPYLDDFNYYDPAEYPGKDEIEMEVDLVPKEKRVATDLFEVSVFKNEQIGESITTKNNIVSAKWDNLTAGTKYGYYVNVKDEFGGEVRSDLWSFQTLAQSVNPNNSNSNSNQNVNNPIDKEPNTNSLRLSEDILNTSLSTVEISVPEQTNKDIAAEITFSDSLLQKAVEGNKEIKLVLQNKVETLFNTTMLKQLVSAEGEIKLTVSDVDSQQVKSLKGQQFSSIVNLDISSNNKPVLFKEDLIIKLPIEDTSTKQVYTGSYLNNATNNWEYAGGKEQDGFWTIKAKQSGTYTISRADVDFGDIETHWANNDINTLAAKRIINGKTDEIFEPNDTLTRKQFTLLLVRALQLPISEYEGLFADVSDADNIDTLQLEAAKRYGITTGRENGEFDSNAVINREQMITMLGRSIELTNPELMSTTNNNTFEDSNKISDYAKKYVNIISSLEFITGKENGNLDPKGDSTRAQAAKVVNRFVTKIEQE